MYKDENFIGVKISRILGCAIDVLPAADRGARSGYDSASDGDSASNGNATSDWRFQCRNGRFQHRGRREGDFGGFLRYF